MKDAKNIFNNSKDFFLDLIFPKFCVGCKKEGVWLCETCQEKIIHIKSPTCPQCNRLTKIGELCKNCRKKSNLTGLIVAAHYQDGSLKEAIHTFKYSGVYELAEPLGKILIQTLKNNQINKNYYLIPVPLHKYRQNERGFNQSELLAKIIFQKLNYPIITKKLLRAKHKKPQMTLTGVERRNNVKGIFAWVGKKDELKNKNIILIDDVFTTGSTLEECAKILRSVGARQVWGLVLAKA